MTTIIGIDPHKRTHTAVVLDDREEIAAQVQVPADRRQVQRLLRWADGWPERVWAVENAHGLGHRLCQQLVARGEVVVDVPATLSARARKLSGHSQRKTDPFDARSVAIAARYNRELRRVVPETDAQVIGLLLERRWHLVSHRQKTMVRLHALLTDLVSGGLQGRITHANAAAMLRSVRPSNAVDVARKDAAREMLTDWRWLDRRVAEATRSVHEAMALYDTGLTAIPGVGVIIAANIIAITGDVHRFRSAAHFAAYAATAPIDASSGDVIHRRLDHLGNRRLNSQLHQIATVQIRRGAAGRTYYDRKRAQGKSHRDAIRSLKRQLATVVYRQLIDDARRREAVRGGQHADDTTT